MKRPVLACLLSAAIGISSANGQPAQADDPTIKALLSRLQDDTKPQKTAIVRAAAYKSMGELGDKGMSARRLLCQGMLDPNKNVAATAADSLKKIDEKMYKLATGIFINGDVGSVKEAGKMKAAAEPLTPLVMAYAMRVSPLANKRTSVEGGDLTDPSIESSASANEKDRTILSHRQILIACARTLAAIAPEDDQVNAAILNMLTSLVPSLRETALEVLTRLKSKKLALSRVLNIATNGKERATNRTSGSPHLSCGV